MKISFGPTIAISVAHFRWTFPSFIFANAHLQSLSHASHSTHTPNANATNCPRCQRTKSYEENGAITWIKCRILRDYVQMETCEWIYWIVIFSTDVRRTIEDEKPKFNLILQRSANRFKTIYCRSVYSIFFSSNKFFSYYLFIDKKAFLSFCTVVRNVFASAHTFRYGFDVQM